MRYYDAILQALGTEIVTEDEFTGAAVLAKLLGVDGAASGLDADLLDGNHAAAFATAAHDHSGVYSPVAHDHSGVYSPVAHDHSGTYQPVDVDLTAIAALTGTGFSQRTGDGTWSLSTPEPATGAILYMFANFS